jgi:hypothetical protein
MQESKTIPDTCVRLFRSGRGVDTPLILVFSVINGLVLINACLHDPRVGYDADLHLAYIQALSKLRLVEPRDSGEFFSPPLPYILPALLIFLTGVKVFWAAKCAQLLNVCLSAGLTSYLIKTCRIISSQSSLAVGSLMSLGILPVYYKTFAFVRGEPYVAFLAVVIMYYTLLIFIRRRVTTINATILGLAMGLCALSRQWGILMFPGVVLFMVLQCIRYPQWRKPMAGSLCLCVLLIALISGWFYAGLRLRYGSARAFNRPGAAHFSLNNQPREFYARVNPKLLFTNPVRPHFADQFLPTFYSETWGDYWGYFTLYGIDTRVRTFVNGYDLYQVLSTGSRPDWLETNYDTVGAYLGRVNLVSIFPSALGLLALVFGSIGVVRRRSHELFTTSQKESTGFLLLAIATSVGGYLWFLIMYPSIGTGDTIKATYMLQVFPFLSILVGNLLEYFNRKNHILYLFVLGCLVLTFAHNIFAMVTHYSLHRLLQLK